MPAMGMREKVHQANQIAVNIFGDTAPDFMGCKDVPKAFDNGAPCS